MHGAIGMADESKVFERRDAHGSFAAWSSRTGIAPSGSSGFAAATARGEAARVQWVKDGLVVPGEQLGTRIGLAVTTSVHMASLTDAEAVKRILVWAFPHYVLATR